MALHIQMSEEAEDNLRRAKLRNKISSIAISLGFVIAGGTALYLVHDYIKGMEEPAFQAYEPPPVNKPPVKKPKVEELSSKSSPPSANIAPPSIVSTSTSNVQMAPNDLPTPDFGMGMSVGIGDGLGGDGIGNGLGEGNGGMGSGNAGGSTLEGTFYDLKQTQNGAATGITPQNSRMIVQVLHDFMNGWNQRTLSKYYKSPTKLYSGSFMLPSCKAEYAPYAYECKDKVQPSAWVAVYRGTVRAPKSGKFRFVGTGDDTFAVRFNRKTVLEAGWAIPSLINHPTHGSKVNHLGNVGEYRSDVQNDKIADKKEYEFLQVPGVGKWNNELGGLVAGDVFTVEAGKDYPIEILISEVPGGAFGFALLIEDVTDGAKGVGNLQLFRTDLSTPTPEETRKLLEEANCVLGGIEWPQYDADSLVWVATP